MSIMFSVDKPIYVTRAIAEELPGEHQLFIYQYFWNQQEVMTDYLQVFNFYIEDGHQFVIQSQEQPERETIMKVPLQKQEPIERTVWMMDQGEDGTIILFPNDY
ncbi:hypothetical protein CSV69_10215 [Sporosarcina sp. P26b]|nr:hypothetical protein CSV69_10215 [Sporosarcina sp. P26b]